MHATRRPVCPRLTLTPTSLHTAEPADRHPHHDPRPCLAPLLERLPLPPRRSLRNSLHTLTHRQPSAQNPSSGVAPHEGAASPAPPYGGGAQPNATRNVSSQRARDVRPDARAVNRPSPLRGGGAARPPIRGWAHTDRSNRPSRPSVSCWLAGVRRGVWWAGMWPGVVWRVSVKGESLACPSLYLVRDIRGAV